MSSGGRHGTQNCAEPYVAHSSNSWLREATKLGQPLYTREASGVERMRTACLRLSLTGELFIPKLFANGLRYAQRSWVRWPCTKRLVGRFLKHRVLTRLVGAIPSRTEFQQSLNWGARVWLVVYSASEDAPAYRKFCLAWFSSGLCSQCIANLHRELFWGR